MVIVDEDDVAFLIHAGNSVSESLVDRDVLLVGCRFVEHLGLGGVWDGVVEARPENLFFREYTEGEDPDRRT